MRDESDERLFRQLSNIAVIVGESARAVSSVQKREKSDGTLYSVVDLLIETQLVAAVYSRWPDMGILSEESHPTIPGGSTYVSIDSLDGSSTYLAGLADWSVSLGIVSQGSPLAGIVVQPIHRRAFRVCRGNGIGRFDHASKIWRSVRHRKPAQPVIGTDISPDSPEGYCAEVRKVVMRSRSRPLNAPAVHAAVEILSGTITAWWSYTTHHWDLAAVAPLLEESGGVAECIDGTAIPWDSLKMPGIILAGSRIEADRLRAMIS